MRANTLLTNPLAFKPVSKLLQCSSPGHSFIFFIFFIFYYIIFCCFMLFGYCSAADEDPNAQSETRKDSFTSIVKLKNFMRGVVFQNDEMSMHKYSSSRRIPNATNYMLISLNLCIKLGSLYGRISGI